MPGSSRRHKNVEKVQNVNGVEDKGHFEYCALALTERCNCLFFDCTGGCGIESSRQSDAFRNTSWHIPSESIDGSIHR